MGRIPLCLDGKKILSMKLNHVALWIRIKMMVHG